MSEDLHRSSGAHAAGLLLAIILMAWLVGLWIYGLPLLAGTPFEELSLIVYLICAAALLAVAERIASKMIARNPG